MAENAKLKPEAAAAPIRNAVRESDFKYPVAAAQIAGEAKHAEVHAAAKEPEFETATGTAAAGATGSFSPKNDSRPSRGPSATGTEVRDKKLGCLGQKGCGNCVTESAKLWAVARRLVRKMMNRIFAKLIT